MGGYGSNVTKSQEKPATVVPDRMPTTCEKLSRNAGYQFPASDGISEVWKSDNHGHHPAGMVHWDGYWSRGM